MSWVERYEDYMADPVKSCGCDPKISYVCRKHADEQAYNDLHALYKQLQRECEELQRRSVPHLRWEDYPIVQDESRLASMAEPGDAILIISYQSFHEVYAWSIHFVGSDSLRQSDTPPKTLAEAKVEAEKALLSMLGIKT